jgi:anti-sigma-K factor RskA
VAEPNGHPDLAARALGRLHPSERAAFDRHLEECGNCRAELSALHETVALLALAAPASQPSAALAGRTFAAIEREATGAAAPRRRRRSWRWPVLAVGAGTGVTVAATALVLALGLGSTPGEPELRAVLAAPSGPAHASVDVRGTGIGRVITFRSDTLPILPKGDYYELWFVGPGDRPGHRNRISAGTFHPDQQGRSHVRFAAAVDPTKFPVLSVTAEPGDGDPRPTGPEVLRSTK